MASSSKQHSSKSNHGSHKSGKTSSRSSGQKPASNASEKNLYDQRIADFRKDPTRTTALFHGDPNEAYYTARATQTLNQFEYAYNKASSSGQK